jgi:5,10-methylenetetrahydrofolate reductase
LVHGVAQKLKFTTRPHGPKPPTQLQSVEVWQAPADTTHTILPWYQRMAIIDTIQRVEKEGGVLISLEFFPARTSDGVKVLIDRVRQTVQRLRPHFVSITWRAQFKDEELWLSIGSQIQRTLGVDVLMHLTCHLPVPDISRILKRCREHGIRNILALRGDPPIGSDVWRPVHGGLRHAEELVALIRREHGDYFCIAVAGYPEVHLESRNSQTLPPSDQARALDISRLKAKCDAGASFVITQHFYDTPILLEFVAAAKAAGIHQPIIPGYLPIQNYASYSRFVGVNHHCFTARADSAPVLLVDVCPPAILADSFHGARLMSQHKCAATSKRSRMTTQLSRLTERRLQRL